MPNFHDVMNHPWWVCRKDMSKGQNDTKNQSYGYNQEAFFKIYLIRCFIKLYFKIIFWIFLAIKYEKKKSLKVKTFVSRKRLKNK